MREIKFRVYLDKMYYQNEYAEYDTNLVEIDFLNKTVTFAAYTDGEEADNLEKYSFDKNSILYKKDLKIMQYTGLKDKNNKEIYEGDVVKLIHTGIEISTDRLEDLKRFVGIIKYENGIFKIVRTEKSLIESKYFEMEQKKVSEIFIYSKLYDIEVVGNIYENPELLKENNN